jgi:hypothetical protein
MSSPVCSNPPKSRGNSAVPLVWAVMAATTIGCAHRSAPAPEPAAKQAIDDTRGLCPTDLNDTQVVVADDAQEVRVMFFTNDPSQTEALHRRVVGLGKALANVHPAVTSKGERVNHVALPAPELREAPGSTNPPRSGWELVMRVPPGMTKDQLRADLDDDVRMWRLGECPELNSPAIRPAEKKDLAKVDQRGTQPPADR